MNKEGFREWLRAAHSEKSTTNRVSRVSRVERALKVLGLPYSDLDEAYDSDRLASVIAALRTWVAKSKSGERPPAPLVRDTTQPDKQILSLMNAIQNYVRFRDGKSPSEGSWPALEQIKNDFLERVPEFERFTKTDNEYEAVERAYKDQIRARVEAIVASDDDDYQAGRKIFEALLPTEGPFLQWNTAHAIDKATPGTSQQFFSVVGELARDRQNILSTIMGGVDRLNTLRPAAQSALTVGEIASIAITVPAFVRPNDSAPFKVRKARKVAKLLTGDQIFKGNDVERQQVESWLALLHRIFDVMDQEWRWEPRDLFDVQGFLWAALDEHWVEDERPEDDEWITLFDAAGTAYRPERQRNQQTDQVAYRIKPAGASNATAAAIETNDVLDVARALLIDGRPVRIATLGTSVTSYLRFPGKLIAYRLRPDIAEAIGLPTESGPLESMQDDPMKAIQQPTNLILYGPPGTGKTFATAEEALRLCGEAVPQNRDELMAAYRRLTDAGRIEFVTFHQSYAYEEFVEGLRPVQREEESAGFHLQAEHGVLRRIARRAETSTGSGGPPFTIGDRQIFKMSIGRANDPDDAYLFEEAIENGYALIGFDDLDWSDPRFERRDEIIARLKTEGNRDGEISTYAGRVQSPDIFRNWMRTGDLIVVSKGNLLFRAIGEVVGDYEYKPRPDGTYSHRRAMKWLWIDRTGVPVEEIYSTKFIQKAIYELTKSEVNIPALERYVESQLEGGGKPDQFVLIIDEINRANVSKVMGELITLLEPDKRIGATNELRVRLPYSRDIFGLPANLHMIGTMNTADRSIALLDTALRRRFKFKEVPPEPERLEKAEQATGLPLVDFLSAINDRIEYLLDREHRIGHAYLMNCRTREAADAAMRDAIIPLLQEYFFEDLSRVAIVLGEPKGGGFLSCRQIKDPLGEGDARDSWSVLAEFAEDAYNVKSDTPVHLVEPAARAAE